MSRYLILFIVNLPFILAATLNTLVAYKLGKTPRRKLVAQLAFWTVILLGLASAQTIYLWLFSHDLTKTEPLSLFDVVQITGIIFLLFLVSGLRSRLESVEQRYGDLHRELSLKTSDQAVVSTNKSGMTN